MASGFAGESVQRFLASVNNEMEEAGREHSTNPMEGESSDVVTIPPAPNVSNQRMPFNAESGTGGNHPTGIGNSSNIVVYQGVYEEVIRRVNLVDDQAGADIFMIANAIEEMCSRIFVVPETVPRILAITGRLKASLGQFRSLTEEANIVTRRYVNTVMEIDRGSRSSGSAAVGVNQVSRSSGGAAVGVNQVSGSSGSAVVAISRTRATDAIRRVESTMERQVDSMDRTADGFGRQADSMDRQADQETKKADQLETEAMSNV